MLSAGAAHAAHVLGAEYRSRGPAQGGRPWNQKIEWGWKDWSGCGKRLLDRRAFLRGGAAFAAAATGYTVARSAGAAPLADDPWSLVPGAISPPYEQRSRFEAKVARTLSNPKGETRTSHARTPHHLPQRDVHAERPAFLDRALRHPDIDPDRHGW